MFRIGYTNNNPQKEIKPTIPQEVIDEIILEPANPRDTEPGPVEFEDMKFMDVKTLRVIYKDCGGEKDLSKATKQTLLKEIEWLLEKKKTTV